jgi:undecaprenol kinase
VKNQSFSRRLGIAFGGMLFALRREFSMRVHVAMAAGVLVILVLLRLAPVWWALLLLTVACVVSAPRSRFRSLAR